MEKAPKDKMMRTRNYRNKRGKSARKTRSFFFPHFGRSVVAESEEEALKIISKKK